jgi:hypothetical protein
VKTNHFCLPLSFSYSTFILVCFLQLSSALLLENGLWWRIFWIIINSLCLSEVFWLYIFWQLNMYLMAAYLCAGGWQDIGLYGIVTPGKVCLRYIEKCKHSSYLWMERFRELIVLVALISNATCILIFYNSCLYPHYHPSSPQLQTCCGFYSHNCYQRPPQLTFFKI